MAKTYHQVCPEKSILVLDSARSIGGTWAKERLYPGLKTNNLLGSYEFGDFPMTPGRFDVKPGHHIPGHAVSLSREPVLCHANIAGTDRSPGA
jgi:cation diffusion facilitator CzcD-associated flavoprotein CzcO